MGVPERTYGKMTVGKESYGVRQRDMERSRRLEESGIKLHIR